MDRQLKLDRYSIRRDAFGWSIIDTLTGQVACQDNVTLTGLSAQDADELAGQLSWLARRDQGSLRGAK